MLHVDYEPGDEPVFNSIHVMDADYRPVGPNLFPLLHQTLVVDADPEVGDELEAQTFVSAICEELP